MCIHINLEARCLVNGKTGEIKHLECFDSLAILHSYLLSSRHRKAAQDLLRDAFKGKQVITELVDHFQE
jgi:hypothetical protein